MTCKEYKDRALQKYKVGYVENVDIVMNLLHKKMLLFLARRLWRIYVMQKSVRSLPEEHVTKFLDVGTHALVLRGRRLVYHV